MKHTPGKWKVRDDDANTLLIVSPWSENVRPEKESGYGDYQGLYICKIEHQNDNPCVSKEQALANARLIATAPEMYEELTIMRDWLSEQLGEWLPVRLCHYPNQQLVEMKEHLDHLEAAIAKAEGR